MTTVVFEPLCAHRRKIGDNYGISCADCGERLSGYGYWAHEEDCWHEFLPMSNDPADGEICLYCQVPRQSKARRRKEWLKRLILKPF